MKHLRDLPMEKGGDFAQRTCEEIANELGLEKEDVISEAHKLDKKDFISWTEKSSAGVGKDQVGNYEKTKYMINPSGIESLEKNWNQRILNIIFGASAILQ
ncbi:MAG: hypothetical protein IIA83_03370 [Thaumarchaeota archaeon]|nr:hypothetical protein [Nitrososphaerota archaeon]